MESSVSCFGDVTSPQDVALLERELLNRTKAFQALAEDSTALERAISRERDARDLASLAGETEDIPGIERNIACLQRELEEAEGAIEFFIKRKNSIREARKYWKR